MKNGRYEEYGDVFWYLDGKLHREDGPAIEHANGDMEWYLNGQSHREDGPAYEGSNGRKQWFLNNQRLTEEEFNHWLDKKNLNEKLHSTLKSRPKEKRDKI